VVVDIDAVLDVSTFVAVIVTCDAVIETEAVSTALVATVACGASGAVIQTTAVSTVPDVSANAVFRSN